MATKFIALWSNPANQTSILAVGETGEAALAEALNCLGDTVAQEDLVAVPVTHRLGAVLDDGREVRRWREIDGVADVADFRYALFSHRENGGFVNHHGTEIAATANEAAREILSDLDLPSEGDYVVVAIPAQLGFSEVFDEVDTGAMLWKPKAGFEAAIGMTPVVFETEDA